MRRRRGRQFGRGRLKIEKPRACIPPTSGLEVLYKLRLARSFMQATACYGFPIYRDCIISMYLSNFLSQKMYRLVVSFFFNEPSQASIYFIRQISPL